MATSPRLPDAGEQPESNAERAFISALAAKGWTAAASGCAPSCDLHILDPNGRTYFAMIKSSAEGRPDRVVALFAQALLESRLAARRGHGRPAVLIWVQTGSPSLIKRLKDFHSLYAAGEAFGVMTGNGLRYLHFPGWSDEEPVQAPRVRQQSRLRASQANLAFSDRTQWMLKLLLAPEIPESLLGGPRDHYKTAADLARAAGVSAMTASRFVNALREKGFLDQSSPYLQLVMRRKLVDLWKAAYKNWPNPVPAKFVIPAPPEAQIEKLLKKRPHSILALFAAADALDMGHVRGVPPSVYVHSMDEAIRWKELKPAREGERPDVLLQPLRFPRSIVAGAVQRNGIHVTDIIQIWLDVSAHPTRGAEQAALLEQTVLAKVVGDQA